MESSNVSTSAGTNTPNTPDTAQDVANSTNGRLSTDVKDASIAPPVVEEPKAIQVIAKVADKNKYVYYVSILIFIILANKTRNVVIDNHLNQYIESALYAGYSYDAIRSSLKVKDSIIDEHFYILKRKGLKPIIRHKTAITGKLPINSKELINQLKVYIKQTLLHYGHHKKIVEEALDN